jgi:Putative Actinobacterial Holin-X, holin superfamily III
MKEAPYHSEPSLAQLLTGIVNDTKELLRQELALAKHEIREDLRKTKTAMLSLGVGVGVAAIGGLLVILMLVHLLHALTPIPLWGCYGIGGGGLVLAGFLLLFRGKKTAEDIAVVPQTVETLKENATWIKNQTTSNKG